MTYFDRFEEIISWQRARVLKKNIFKMTKSSPFAKDYDLVRQIRRSSGSAMDNIAEGFGRDGNPEFVQFLSVSKASACEVQSQLYQALDMEYISQNEFDSSYGLADEVIRINTSLINKLKNSDYQGPKKNRGKK